jgi:hypothetical protein
MQVRDHQILIKSNLFSYENRFSKSREVKIEIPIINLLQVENEIECFNTIYIEYQQTINFFRFGFKNERLRKMLIIIDLFRY